MKNNRNYYSDNEYFSDKVLNLSWFGKKIRTYLGTDGTVAVKVLQRYTIYEFTNNIKKSFDEIK